MQVVMALFDATNPGGMPIRTQEDVNRRERYRKQKEAAKKKPPEEQKTPDQRKLEQKSIEQYFQQFKVKEQAKEKVLPKITDIVYDRNMLVVKHEAESDAYRKKQLETEITELEQKIAALVKENQ